MAVSDDSHAALLGDEPKPAPGSLALVQAFVNTRDNENRREALASPRGLAEWLTRAGYAGGEADAADLDRVLRAREALRALLVAHTDGAEPDPAALRELDEVAGGVTMGVGVAGGGLRLGGRGAAADRLLGDVLAAAHDAHVAGTWARLKACADPACRWVFFDASKNRGGAWCEMRICGNRNKDRRFRARRRAAGGGPSR